MTFTVIPLNALENPMSLKVRTGPRFFLSRTMDGFFDSFDVGASTKQGTCCQQTYWKIPLEIIFESPHLSPRRQSKKGNNCEFNRGGKNQL